MLEPVELLFRVPELVHQALHAADDVRVRRLQQPADLLEALLFFPDRLIGASSGQDIEPPHPRGDARLGNDLEQTDITRGLGVRAAAELLAHFLDRHDPDLVAVFFIEQCHCARSDGLVDVHDRGLDGMVLDDPLVYQLLDAFFLAFRERRVVREIEPAPVRRNERTRLLDVLAEDRPERGVEDVGGRVVPHGIEAVLDLDLAQHRVARP